MKQIISPEIEYFRIINEFTVNLLKQDSIEGVAWSIVKDGVAHLGFVDCVVYLIEGEELIQKAAHGPKEPRPFNILNPIKIPIGKGIVGTAAYRGEVMIVKDTSLESCYIVDDDFRLSELSVPIILEGKVIGVIDSEHPDKDFFTPKHISILTTIAAMAATKISQEQAKQALKDANEHLEILVRERTNDLELALERINIANEDLKQFAYSVSHDLRQPLRMISSYVQLLKRRFSNVLNAEGLEYIDFAYGGAMRAQMLVNDLLQYARIGVNEDDFVVVDLNKTLASVLNNLKNEIETFQPQIIISQLPEINGVKTLIAQIFQNLIHNALKFRRGEQTIIKIRTRETEAFYHFEIEDNGIGIPEKECHSIFEIFSRASTEETFEGTGLGLAICKKIVLKHGGRIGVTSVVGQGSIFHFSIKK